MLAMAKGSLLICAHHLSDYSRGILAHLGPARIRLSIGNGGPAGAAPPAQPETREDP